MSAPPPDATRIEGFAAVIPAGGVGSRLWPLSRADRPKFLLDLLGQGTTLLQETVSRLAALTDQVMVVTGAAHAPAVASQLPHLSADDVIAEPSPRDSMAAIALAAAVLEHRHGPLVMGSFAADHVIGKPQALRDAVRVAVRVALTGKIVTIGISPTYASDAFGYIETGDVLDGPARHVVAFTEKPDAATAQRMVDSGRYVWNAGMFVMRTDVLLGHLERLQPTIAAGVRELAAAWDSPSREQTLARVWPTLTRIAIDHAIAEPVAAAGGVAVVPADLDWHDVGDFDSLAEVLVARADGITVVNRDAPSAQVDARGVVIVGGDRPVVVVGVDGAVVVDTPDALLVTTRQKAQLVKNAANALDQARM